MVLAPIETTPVLLLRFTKDAPADLILFVKERLKNGGLVVVTEEDSPDGGVLLGLSTTQDELEAEAEQIKLTKLDRERGIMEDFTVRERKCFFLDDSKTLRPPASDDDAIGSSATELDSLGLFTSSERVLLVWSMLDDIHVQETGKNTSNLTRKLDEMKIPYLHQRHYLQQKVTHGRSLNAPPKESSDAPDVFSSEGLRHVLESNGMCDLVSPIHNPRIRDRLLKDTLSLTTASPVQAIREYYGEEVAYYFAWLDHFTRWLLFPGILGLVIFVARKWRGDTVDICDLTPFHGIATVIWAILFLRFWERTENRLAYDWGTFTSSGYARKYYNVRPEFEGELRTSPITGRLEKYYPAPMRRLKYVGSALVTLVLLSGAFFVMILSLNLQGYINTKDDPDRWNDEHQHPFHYPVLSALAEEGNIFDVASSWKCFLPVILHVMTVMTMNAMYRKIAERLTEWENHETEVSHRNSLILKRFLFEVFDAYIVLLYLAFFERDIKKLRFELVSIFNIDTFRRALVECVLPVVVHWLGGRKLDDEKSRQRKKTDEGTTVEYTPLKVESNRDEYEQFDDYLEMIISLGYVTIFASAYPAGAFVAILANFVEVRTDMIKISKICLRPRSIRTDGIGMWHTLICGMIWTSALTNCLIFGMTSQQLLQWFPDLYTIDSRGEQHFKTGSGWVVVFIVFGIERLLLLIGIVINAVVPELPEDVVMKKERRSYVLAQEALRLRDQERSTKIDLQRSQGFSEITFEFDK